MTIPIEPPICKKCGTPKRLRFAGKSGTAWRCQTCHNRYMREERERYNARKAAGLSPTGVPLDAESQTEEGKRATAAAREGQDVVSEHFVRERRLGIGGKRG